MVDPRRRDNDVVLQTPEDYRVVIPVVHTSTACAGSVTAYLLRRIAYRAGAYAPGLHEHVFFELAQHSICGASIDAVERWFVSHAAELQGLGYRLSARRVAAPTEDILTWVKAGTGYRGALFPTTHRRLHPNENDDIAHAVGVTVDRLAPDQDELLMMVDPWPGTKHRAADRTAVSAALEPAHRDHRYHSMIFYWAGWS